MVIDSGSTFVIRLLEQQDIAKLVDFRCRHGDHPLLGPTRERCEHSRSDSVERDLANTSYSTFGWFDGPRLVGVVTSILLTGIAEQDWSITGLLVDPGHLRRGIAQSLIGTCCDQMLKRTHTCFIVTYHPEGGASTAARSLYMKLGFEDFNAPLFSHSEQGVRYFKQPMSAGTAAMSQRLQAATPTK